MTTESFPYRRIAVIGVTGSGKSTLAENLARKFSLDFIELDALYWQPDWKDPPAGLFTSRVEAAVRSQAWAVAGNYREVRPLIWPRAEAVVWLDYPLGIILYRLWVRTWQRWYTRELLWGTNYERLIPQFKIWSKESLFYYAIRSHRTHRRDYPPQFRLPEYSHLKVFHLRSPRETADWLESI
jgi:adenylate kinase family enzyme